MTRTLDELYKDPRSSGSLGGVTRLYRVAKEYGHSLNDVKKYLSGLNAYSLHRDRCVHFRRNIVVTYFEGYQHAADLTDVSRFKHLNNGYCWLLFSIDCFTRYLHVIPLKRKTPEQVKSAFEKIHMEATPLRLRTDRGREFDNKMLREYYKRNGINYFTSQDKKIKCSIVERSQRTIKERLWRLFTLHGKARWFDDLENVIANYNNSYHSSIKMSPREAQEAPASKVFDNLYAKSEVKKSPRLHVGDKVRSVYDLSALEKSLEPKFKDSIETVIAVIGKKQPLYRLSDYTGKEIKRRFNEPEVQKVTENYYRVEKILKTRTVGGKKQHLVKWLNFPSSANSWIGDNDLESGSA